MSGERSSPERASFAWIDDYAEVHRDWRNLLIHLFAVPLFPASLVGVGWAVVVGDYALAGLLCLGPAVSMGLQGLGHRLEAQPPKPFTGPLNVAARIFGEQLFKWHVYLLSGRWRRGP